MRPGGCWRPLVSAKMPQNIWALLVFAVAAPAPVTAPRWISQTAMRTLVLMGMMLALVIGGMGFEAMGLSSEIGALVMGVLLSTHSRAKELGTSLWSLKEIFLVGFFLQIGLTGLPDGGAIVFAVAAGIALAFKGALFFALMVAFKLRTRSAFLTALSLTAYSEFGLIVAAGVLPDYLVPLAIAVSVSFVISAPLNRFAHPLYERFESRLRPFERDTMHPDEQPRNMGDADVLIFGMGRTGSAAYRFIADQGLKPLGLDAHPLLRPSRTPKQGDLMSCFADALLHIHRMPRDRIVLLLGAISRLRESSRAQSWAMDDLDGQADSPPPIPCAARLFTGPIVSHALSRIAPGPDPARRARDYHLFLTMNQRCGVSLPNRQSKPAAEGLNGCPMVSVSSP